MESQIAFQSLLKSKLLELQHLNPRFSLRAFAQRLDLNPGVLSALLNGKRMASEKLVARVSDRLMLDPHERSTLLDSFEKRRLKNAGVKNTEDDGLNYLRISSAQFRVLAEWEHLAIVSLLETVDFESSPAWIADRLGISKPRAERAVDRLVELEVLRRRSDGTLEKTNGFFRTTDDIADVSIRKFHDQSLELAKKSLHQHSIHERDFSAIMISISPDQLTEAKALIRKFQDELADLLEKGEQTEVYQFACQLFPLTVTRETQIQAEIKTNEKSDH